jgi:hypothetical protein
MFMVVEWYSWGVKSDKVEAWVILCKKVWTGTYSLQ